MNKLSLSTLEKYDIVAIRGTDVKMEVGDICDKSYDWDYEYDVSSFDTENPVELSGSCAMLIGRPDWDDEDEMNEAIEKAIEAHKKAYYYKYIYIVAGDYYEYGNDEDEIIIQDAVVICEIN